MQSNPTGDIISLNNWKNRAHINLSCKSVDTSGKEVFAPYYISTQHVLESTSALTPVTSFSVPFVHNIRTRTMIDVTEGIPGHFEINKGQFGCEVLYDIFSGGVKDQWKAVKNATKLN